MLMQVCFRSLSSIASIPVFRDFPVMETEAWNMGISGDIKKKKIQQQKIPFLIKNEVLMLMCLLISSNGDYNKLCHLLQAKLCVNFAMLF